MTAQPVSCLATDAKLLVVVRCVVGGGIHHGFAISRLVIGLGLGLHIIIPFMYYLVFDRTPTKKVGLLFVRLIPCTSNAKVFAEFLKVFLAICVQELLLGRLA